MNPFTPILQKGNNEGKRSNLGCDSSCLGSGCQGERAAQKLCMPRKKGWFPSCCRHPLSQLMVSWAFCRINISFLSISCDPLLKKMWHLTLVRNPYPTRRCKKERRAPTLLHVMTLHACTQERGGYFQCSIPSFGWPP